MEMDSSHENATPDKVAEKYVSKSDKKKTQLVLFSKSKTAPIQIAAPYSVTSSKTKIPKNINWHESEWPELPKPGFFSPQLDSKFKENSLVEACCSSSQYWYESSSKEGDKNSHKTELSRVSCETKDLQRHITENCEEDSVYVVQNYLTSELEDLTCGLTSLEIMSSKCRQLPIVINPENACLQTTCIEKRPPQNWEKKMNIKDTRMEKTVGKQKAFLTGEIEDNTCLLQGNQPSLCSDDFPDLLTMKIIKKKKKKFLPLVENQSAKKQAKKYPKKNDPIFINLGEVLENSSSNQDCKNVLRNRYSRDIWCGSKWIDTTRRVIKRGKQREFPKRKTRTKLKLAILRGREQRLRSRQPGNASSSDLGSCSTDLSFTDFLKTRQPDTLSKDFISLFKESQTSQERSDNDILRHCSCDVTSLDGQSQCNFLEINKVTISSKEKEEPRINQTALYAFTEESPNLTYFSNELLQLAKSSIHSSKFREYCNNDKCANLDDKAKSFVRQIYGFQTKSHFRDADKARIHRRYALGLREADKFFKLRKLKVLIIATDLEANTEEGGLNEMIESMKSRASKENLPVIFALKRRDLAYCVYRKVPVSCMAVLNYEGAEELFRAMIDAWREAMAAYDKKLKEKLVSILSARQDFKTKVNDTPSPPSGPLISPAETEVAATTECQGNECQENIEIHEDIDSTDTCFENKTCTSDKSPVF